MRMSARARKGTTALLAAATGLTGTVIGLSAKCRLDCCTVSRAVCMTGPIGGTGKDAFLRVARGSLDHNYRCDLATGATLPRLS